MTITIPPSKTDKNTSSANPISQPRITTETKDRIKEIINTLQVSENHSNTQPKDKTPPSTKGEILKPTIAAPRILIQSGQKMIPLAEHHSSPPIFKIDHINHSFNKKNNSDSEKQAP